MDLKKTKEFYLYNCIHITFPYPGTQEKVNDPWVLWPKAFSWQLLKSVTLVYTCISKQERSYSGFSLARLEITSRNKEAVNSTRDTIYSLKVFLLPTLSTSILFICFWIDLVRVLATTGNNVCGRRLCACINTRKFKGLDSREVTSLPEIKKSYLHGTSFQSSPKINRMPITRPLNIAYNKSFQHPTLWVLLIQILFFFSRPLSSVHVFQSNQRFRAIEFVNLHVSEKL